jgi:hypothetical protein
MDISNYIEDETSKFKIGILAERVHGITFIRFTLNRKTGKPNDSRFWVQYLGHVKGHFI